MTAGVSFERARVDRDLRRRQAPDRRGERPVGCVAHEVGGHLRVPALAVARADRHPRRAEDLLERSVGRSPPSADDRHEPGQQPLQHDPGREVVVGGPLDQAQQDRVAGRVVGDPVAGEHQQLVEVVDGFGGERPGPDPGECRRVVAERTPLSVDAGGEDVAIGTHAATLREAPHRSPHCSAHRGRSPHHEFL
jgi:hypothetical protein